MSYRFTHAIEDSGTEIRIEGPGGIVRFDDWAIAAPATLLAVSAWVRGDGAMANIALSRALSADPDYALAGLLSEALAACVPPDGIRQVITETLDRLDDPHPAG